MASRKPKSKIFAAIHEMVSDMHEVGIIDDAKMREFDESCLEPAGAPPSRTKPAGSAGKAATGQRRTA